MNGSWSLVLTSETCGFDGAKIEKDDLAWKMGGIVRCEVHAPAHARLTEAKRHALKHAQQAIQPAPRNLRQDPSFERVSPDAELKELLRDKFGIKGYRRSKPKPYAEVADDPAVVRAGDES